jgi:LysM repeat protein
MNPSQSSNARIAAIGALAIAFVVVLVVIVSSLGSDGDSGQSSTQSSNSSGHVAKSTPVESGRKVYVVKPGDTFSQIAGKVGISVDKLQALNPGIDQFSLHSGDRVKLR